VESRTSSPLFGYRRGNFLEKKLSLLPLSADAPPYKVAADEKAKGYRYVQTIRRTGEFTRSRAASDAVLAGVLFLSRNFYSRICCPCLCARVDLVCSFLKISRLIPFTYLLAHRENLWSRHSGRNISSFKWISTHAGESRNAISETCSLVLTRPS